MSFQPLITIMTSDTTPAGMGECICSTYYADNYRAYIAFNGSTFNLSQAGTFWGPSSQDNNQWVGFKFLSKRKINYIVFKTAQQYYTAGYSGDIDLIVSNDGENWTVLKTYTITVPYYTAADLSISINVPSNDGYLYWAIKFKYQYAGAGEMQFYGNDQALVPTMTSMTTPYGKVFYEPSSLTFDSGYEMWKAFDGNDSTAGGSNQTVRNTGRLERSVGYEFNHKVKPTFFQFKWGGSNNNNYTFTLVARGSNDGVTWDDLCEEVTIAQRSVLTSVNVTARKAYKYLKISYVGYTCPTNIGYPQAHTIQFYGDPNPHEDAAGDITAIRDWLNSSLYNKDEITDLFVQNNSGLQAYDLTLIGEPDQLIRVVGQTSGKSYTICLDMLGEDMKETVLWTNSESTNPSTIELSDDWINYKFIAIIGKTTVSAGVEVLVGMYPVTMLNTIYNNSQTPIIGVSEGTPCVWYKLTGTKNLTLHTSNTYIIYQILGYV